MADPQTAQLLRKLHYQGIVSTPRLREILQKFHALPVQELIDHLIGDGTIDQAWVDASRHAIRIRARRQRDPEQSEQLDDAFGNLALGRGWITLAQLEAAILEQQRLGRLKLQFRVGEILLNQRLLSIDQVRELLESQGLAVGGCEECSSIVKLVAGAGDDGVPCPFCSGEVSPSQFLDLVQTDG